MMEEDVLDQEGPLVLPGGENIGLVRNTPTAPELQEKPSFSETAAASFRQFNDVYRSAKYVEDKVKNAYEERNTDFNARQEGYFERVPDDERYQIRLLDATSEQEANLIVDNINQEMADNDIRERSGILASGATILGASILSPTTLIPIASTAKYASLTKGAFMNGIRTAGTMAPAFALQNAILTSTKETEGLKEWASDTILDTFVAGSFGGVLGAFASKGVTSELKAAKGFFKAAEDEVQIKLEVNDAGVVTGKMLASPLPGGSAGAAQVEGVQNLLDSGVKFKDNAYIRNAFGAASPIVRLVTNRFKIVRDFGNAAFSHPFETANKTLGAIQEPAAENFNRAWKSRTEGCRLVQEDLWLKSQGIQGPGKGIRGTIGEWTGRNISSEEFSDEVGRAVRSGTSEIPEALDAAKAWDKELYEPLFKELQKRNPTLEKH